MTDYERRVLVENRHYIKKHGDPWGPKLGACCQCGKQLDAYDTKLLCITDPLMRCTDHGDWPMIGWIYYTDG